MAPAMRGELAAAMPAQLWFPGTASAVGQARRFVTGAIGDGFPALDDVLVLVSEVASNAVKHTASGIPRNSTTRTSGRFLENFGNGWQPMARKL